MKFRLNLGGIKVITARLLKKITIAVMIFVVGSIPLLQCGFSNVAYAQLPGTESADGIGNVVSTDMITILETVNKGVYLLLRPSLAIGGAALSNDLVYGKAFFLDRSLWKFRQMMRTFANYLLGFMFLGTILMAFAQGSGGEQSGVQKFKDLFKNVLIAGLLINFSRWMVAAMIDLSTIGVVALGGLPLNVMGTVKAGSDTDVARDKIRFLTPITRMDLVGSDNEDKNESVYSSISTCSGSIGQGIPSAAIEKYYLPCLVLNGTLADEGYVGAAQTRENYREEAIKSRVEVSAGSSLNIDSNTVTGKFCTYGGQLIEYKEGEDIQDPKKYQALLKAGSDEKVTQQCSKISDLATKVSASTGPLYTLYGSLFQMSQMAATTNFGNITEVSFEMLMKAIVGIALLIPLIVLAAVLVVRAVYLWLVIVFSPILVLAYTFKLKILEKGGDKAQLGTIVSLIFLPVFAVFALSISVVFLSILQNITLIEETTGAAAEAREQESGANNDPVTIFNNVKSISKEGKDKCYEFMGIQTVCFDEGDRVLGSNIVNVLSWLVINFMGIALMWTVVFFVLKSNAVTKSLAEGAEKLAKQGMMSLPIIPVGGGESVSLGGVKEFVKSNKRLLDNYQKSQYEGGGLKSLVDNTTARMSGTAREQSQRINENVNGTFLNANAGSAIAANTAITDDAYNNSVETIVNEINRRRGSDAPQLQARTMQELVQNPIYQDYVDTTLGTNYQTNALRNLNKKEDSRTIQEVSELYVNGLRAAAQAAGDEGFVREPDEENRLTEPAFYYANGILKRVRRQRDRAGNTVVNKTTGLRAYQISRDGLNSQSDVRAYNNMIRELAGTPLPESMSEYMNNGTVIEAIRRDIPRHADGTATSHTGEVAGINMTYTHEGNTITSITLEN